MGQCAILSSGKASSNPTINRMLEEDAAVGSAAGGASKAASRAQRGTVTKLLLLGTGNSGKSTVFKQFQLVHSNGFTDAEKQFYRQLMVESTIGTIRRLLQNANDLLFEGLIKEGGIDEQGVMVLMSNKAASTVAARDAAVPEKDDAEQLYFSEAIEAAEPGAPGGGPGGGAGGAKGKGRRSQPAENGPASGIDSSTGRRGTDLSGGRGTNLSEFGSSHGSAPVGAAPGAPGREGKDASSPTNVSIPSAAVTTGGGSKRGTLRDMSASAAAPPASAATPRGSSMGASTVISDEVAHLADIVKTLPPSTSLLQKFPVTLVRDNLEEQEVSITVADMLKRIWNDPIIQRVYSMEGKMPTLESPIAYYMSEIDRIASKDFVPSEEDILYSRKQTRQVQQLQFVVEGKKFSLIDVGGQRIERRKWINYFEDVDAVIFVVGLDGYNQLCLEDGRTNRMREALDLFKDICESPYFANTNFLLFLNKCDLFQDKIRTVPLSVCFKSYTGAQNDYEQTIQYIRKRFVDTHTRFVLGRASLQMGVVTPKVYPHVTCATATEQMRFVIATCQSICLRKGLAQCGIAAM
jgi:GTPase SAR1 family protein